MTRKRATRAMDASGLVTVTVRFSGSPDAGVVAGAAGEKRGLEVTVGSAAPAGTAEARACVSGPDRTFAADFRAPVA
ncbi:hypothetical protein ACIGD1_10040 [Streptomyces sp. NPDC085612]|uniref:hypothetical protein n=1 Tax=Streptomyces sp. NPDC085612 TaxID=3365732 RepID=UPI0037CFD993